MYDRGSGPPEIVGWWAKKDETKCPVRYQNTECSEQTLPIIKMWENCHSIWSQMNLPKKERIWYLTQENSKEDCVKISKAQNLKFSK